ncbi:rod-binding protein [[Bacteroides] pectinophilus]|nr:rod-binding protein [[Bacteroides] pectinophilus]UWN95419.1 rod-binding protein [[Bacteroides] pectinophilus]
MSDLITSGIGSYYMDSVSDTSSSTSELEKTLGSGDLSNASDDELMQVCKDFESYFIEQMFKSMEKMIPKDEDEDESSSMSSMTDYYKEEMMSKYAEYASESDGGKGLGIAQTLYEQMKRTYGSSELPEQI